MNKFSSFIKNLFCQEKEQEEQTIEQTVSETSLNRSKYPYLEKFSVLEKLKAKNSIEYQLFSESGRRMTDKKKMLENFMRSKVKRKSKNAKFFYMSDEDEEYYIECFKQAVEYFKKNHPGIDISHDYKFYYKTIGHTLTVSRLYFDFIDLKTTKTYHHLEYEVDESFSYTHDVKETVDDIYSHLKFVWYDIIRNEYVDEYAKTVYQKEEQMIVDNTNKDEFDLLLTTLIKKKSSINNNDFEKKRSKLNHFEKHIKYLEASMKAYPPNR